MARGNVTPIGPHVGPSPPLLDAGIPRPPGWVRFPGHPEVIVSAFWSEASEVAMCYEGEAHVLIAAGVATPRMLEGSHPGAKALRRIGQALRVGPLISQGRKRLSLPLLQDYFAPPN